MLSPYSNQDCLIIFEIFYYGTFHLRKKFKGALSKISVMWDYSQSKLEIMDIFTLSGMDLQYYQPQEALASRGWLYCKSIPREVNISIISNLLWE